MSRIYFSTRKFPSTRRLYSVLNSIPGVGQKLILGLFNKLGIPLHTRIKDMNSFQISQATSMLETLSTFEDLIRFRIRLLKLHRSVGTYRGIRLRQGLPRNGQRTHSNAKNPRKLRGRIF